MAAGQTFRSSDVLYNGKALFTLAAGAVAINGTVKMIRWVQPYTGVIKSCYANPSVTITNAAARLRVGSVASPTALLNDYVLTNLTSIGEIIGSFASVAVTQGTAYQVGFVDADTTGELDVTLVIAPQ